MNGLVQALLMAKGQNQKSLKLWNFLIRLAYFTLLSLLLRFKVNSGEYKLMGLAPYGEPRFVDLILKNLLDPKDDGSFQ